MSGVAIEELLELWSAELRGTKARLRPLFLQASTAVAIRPSPRKRTSGEQSNCNARVGAGVPTASPHTGAKGSPACSSARSITASEASSNS